MKNLSTAFVVLAALCWGLSGGIGGILISDDWDAFTVSWYRGVIGLLFVLAWLMLRPDGNGLNNKRLWFWSVVAGIGVAGNFSFYFVSIAEGSVAVAVTLMYSAPVFVYLVSLLLKLEKSTPFKWTSIAIVILGISLLTEIYDVDSSGVTVIGVGAGLLAGISYTIFIFGFKNAVSHGSPQATLSIAFAVLVAVLIWPSDNQDVIAVLSAPDWLLFVVLGILGAGLSFIIYIKGLKHTAPVVASIVAMAEPVTASLFGVLLLSESLGLLQIFGMGLILVTVTALSVKSDNQMTLPSES